MVELCKRLIDFAFVGDSSKDIAMTTNLSRKIGFFCKLIFIVALPFQNGLEYRNAVGSLEAH